MVGKRLLVAAASPCCRLSRVLHTSLLLLHSHCVQLHNNVHKIDAASARGIISAGLQHLGLLNTSEKGVFAML